MKKFRKKIIAKIVFCYDLTTFPEFRKILYKIINKKKIEEIDGEKQNWFLTTSLDVREFFNDVLLVNISTCI